MAILQHIGRGPKSEIAAALQSGALVIGDLVVTTGANGNELILIERDGSQVVIKSRTQSELTVLGKTVPAGSDIDAVVGVLAEAFADTLGDLPEGKTVAQAIAEAQAAATYNDSEVRSLISAAQNKVDALGAKIGNVAQGTTVVQMIEDAQAAATYDDTQVKADIKANADAIAAHKESIDNVVTTLVGDDTNKSVRTIANEELAAQLLSGNADADFKTLQELATWLEDHPEDAAEMNLAITNLQNLVGTIPEGATATDIVGYIQELVNAEKSRAEGVEGGLDERITELEGLVGDGGSVDDKIEAAKQAAITSANGYTDEKMTAEVTARNEAIATAKGEANTYTDNKVAGEVTARNEAIATAKGEANTYTDGKIDAEVTARNEAIAAADATNLAAAKAYTDGKISAATTWVDFGTVTE